MTDIISNVPVYMHPGLVLIFAGLLAAVLPKACMKFVVTIGPALALALTLILQDGDACIIPFINDMELYVLLVDKLNYVFGMIFGMAALIGGIYSMHNKDKLEAASAMIYGGASLGVTLCGDWLTLIFFWELMAAASLFVVWAKRSEQSTKAGFRYLLVHMFDIARKYAKTNGTTG